MLSVDRKVVVGGEGKSFTQATYLRLKGSQQDIGAFLARETCDVLGGQKGDAADSVMTRGQRRFMKVNWPAHYQRMLGLENELGISREDDRIDTSFFNYDVGAPGCSVAFYPGRSVEGEHSILSRNFDFTIAPISEMFANSGFELAGHSTYEREERPAVGRPYIIETRPDVGIPSLFLCAYDLLGAATDGVNAEGLAVALMMDVGASVRLDHWEPNSRNIVGLSEIQVPRFLLESCKNAAEAREYLLSTHQSYAFMPAHFLVCDAEGDAFVWEYSLSRNVPRITDCGDLPFACTNHLVYEGYEPSEEESELESINRKARLDGLIEESPKPYSISAIRNANAAVQACDSAGEGQYIDENSPARTLWYSLYDLNDRSLTVDFYIGEDSSGIRRSPPMEFRLMN